MMYGITEVFFHYIYTLYKTICVASDRKFGSKFGVKTDTSQFAILYTRII